MLTGGTSAGVTADRQPSAIFRQLQNVPFRSSELPPHFRLLLRSSPPYPGRPTAWRPGHPVAWRAGGAELAFALEGPDRIDLVGYTVYQTPRQARAALSAGPKSHRFGFAPSTSRLVGRVRGFSISTLWRARDDGMLFVEAEVLSGFVEVRSLTVVASRSGQGDIAANVAMIRVGLRHLHRVETKTP